MAVIILGIAVIVLGAGAILSGIAHLQLMWRVDRIEHILKDKGVKL